MPSFAGVGRMIAPAIPRLAARSSTAFRELPVLQFAQAAIGSGRTAFLHFQGSQPAELQRADPLLSSLPLGLRDETPQTRPSR